MSLIDASADNEHAAPPIRNLEVAPCEAIRRATHGYVQWTDHELVLAPPETRDGAYAELYVRHSASVAAVARTVLGADPGCDDVVADVFTALWSAPEKFDPLRGSLRGFLRVGARGRSLDHLRSETTRHHRERNDESCRPLHSSIDAAFLAAETGQELRRAMSRLPEGERIAIELAFFTAMTYREVARRLELPEGTIKSRIRSGLRRLGADIDLDIDIDEYRMGCP